MRGSEKDRGSGIVEAQHVSYHNSSGSVCCGAVNSYIKPLKAAKVIDSTLKGHCGSLQTEPGQCRSGPKDLSKLCQLAMT
ncbi:hypothetical protein NPIL_485911 [Nephila pilipes]|uniref:Uncharacterized protein n=2 Tax=Nephila pilipes TaxID=299642 RepID=A0A8X6NMR3_NEPPI|nr:hypothetical protein NPIL_485911 [Nephila pilipes]